MMNQRRSRGFTLIEMLVVIAVIAILVAILTPVYGRVREHARQAKCTSNLVQIAQAVNTYKRDKGRFPRSLFDLYPDYISSADPFICPNDNTPYAKSPLQNRSLIYSSYAGEVPRTVDPVQANILWNYNGYVPPDRSGNYYVPQDPHGVQLPPGPPDANQNGMHDDAEADYQRALMNAGLTNHTKWPRLYNRQAPDYTIITHCRFHRNQTGNEIIVRLNGTTSKGIKFSVDPRTGEYVTKYNWTLQPEQ
ncbi:MAG: type II secretion system GspH family protein [Abditibacteriales bacterium]|nr:type II secretion system GspH family protein [Abditibacteriales bacterium]